MNVHYDIQIRRRLNYTLFLKPIPPTKKMLNQDTSPRVFKILKPGEKELPPLVKIKYFEHLK